MARHYRAEVKDLIRSLNDPDSRTESADKLRSLMDKIVLTPKKNSYGMDIDLHGSLAGILTVASKNKDKTKRAEIIQQVMSVAEGCDRYAHDMQDKMVAGVRNSLLLLFMAKDIAVHSSHCYKARKRA